MLGTRYAYAAALACVFLIASADSLLYDLLQQPSTTAERARTPLASNGTAVYEADRCFIMGPSSR